jgi:hypothetical protein
LGLVKMEVVCECGVGVVDLAWGIGAPDQREATMDCCAQGVLGVAQGVGGGDWKWGGIPECPLWKRRIEITANRSG